jgi:uncharacterized protein (DUF58 family)
VPTPRGWLVVAAGVGLWVTSSALGADALSSLGFGLLALVVISVLVVRMGKHDVSVARTVTPQRAQAGRPVTVGLTLHNKGRGAAPLLLLEDRVGTDLASRARFAVRGIEARGDRSISYELRPPKRGRYEVGPLQITITDPFGVARLTSVGSETSEFLAFPRTERLILPKDAGSRRTITTSARRQPTGNQGEDFYTLREYVEGDDLRRIHWPATAKRDRYMIRQEETPWHARATILLDDHAGAYTAAGWERAVEVAASMCDLYHRSGYAFRLTPSIAHGVPSGRGSDHFHRCLDVLATIEPSDSNDGGDPLLKRLNEIESHSAIEGVLIAVIGAASVEQAHAITRTARRFKMVVAVAVPAGGSGPRDAVAAEAVATLLRRAGVKSLVLKPGASLSTAWSALWSVWGAPGEQTGGDSWAPKQERV